MVCFDAKINFDDAAKFRQKPIFEQEDTTESDPREVEAARSDLNYIGMTGNIGCLGIGTRMVHVYYSVSKCVYYMRRLAMTVARRGYMLYDTVGSRLSKQVETRGCSDD